MTGRGCIGNLPFYFLHVQTGPSQHEWVVQVQALSVQRLVFTLDAETIRVIKTPATMLNIIFFILCYFDFELILKLSWSLKLIQAGGSNPQDNRKSGYDPLTQ